MNQLLRGRLRWLLIFWVFVMSSISYLDRVNISIAGQEIQKTYQLNNIQLGWVFSSFVLAYALFQAPGGRLADRFGPRRVITLGVFWWSLFTALTALVPASWAFALLLLVTVRFLLGAGEAVVYPASNRLVANWIPTQERGIANGLVFAGVGAGAGVTPPLITHIMVNYGWQWAFYVCALIGVVAGVVWHLIARDTPEQHPWITDEERRHIEAGLTATVAELERRITVPWSRILGNRHILSITLSYFAYGYVAWIFFTWFFIYLSKVRGLDLKSSALYSMLPFIAMATCSPLGGWISDSLTRRFGKRIGRCGVGVFGMALSGIFIAAATQVESPQLASVVLAGGVGALYLSQSIFWAVTADIAGASAGSASGLMNMGGQVGGAVTSVLTPWIAEQLGWNFSFLVAAGLAVLASLLWLQVNPHERLQRGT